MTRELLPFQQEGVERLLSQRSTLLADEQGLGKTVQVIGMVNADTTIRDVLIVCPLSVALNWQREWLAWSTRDLTVGVATAREWPNTNVVIIHYDALRRHLVPLRSREWDLVVADEAHYLKNPKAQRTQALLGNRRKGLQPVTGRRKIALTGTPIPNRPVELWPILHWLDPGTWHNWRAFVTRYCGGYLDRWGWQVGGATNLRELHSTLLATGMVRRKKADVLDQLPAKRRQLISLPVDAIQDGKRLVRREQELVKALAKLHARQDPDEQALWAADAEGDEVRWRAAIAALSAKVTDEIGELSALRRELGVAKLPLVIEHVNALLESGVPKVVVWAHHRDVLDGLTEGLAEHGVVRIDGNTPGRERQALVDQFQGNPATRVFVGGITAAGTGITLTAASLAVFAELDWVPGHVLQAEDRIHRIGQRDAVLIHDVVIDGTLDAFVAQLLVRKLTVAETAIDGRNPEDGVETPAPVPKPRSSVFDVCHQWSTRLTVIGQRLAARSNGRLVPVLEAPR